MALPGATSSSGKRKSLRHAGDGVRAAVAGLALALAGGALVFGEAGGFIEKGVVRFAYDRRGITGLAHTRDPFGAHVTAADRPLGMTLRYRTCDGDWAELDTTRSLMEVEPVSGTVRYTSADGEAPLKAVQTFSTDGTTLDWTITLAATSAHRVTIGDLAIEVPVVSPYGFGEDARQIFERGFTRHAFISGHGSFIYYVRASGVPPFLLMTVVPGTKLEYFERRRRRTLDFIHSSLSGGREQRGTWRQKHTELQLGPAGDGNGTVSYGLRFQWANSHDDLRMKLYQEGLFDIRVVPGMTLPEDLAARFALHTRAEIESVDAEHPSKTSLRALGEPRPGHRLYEVSFRRLGENLLTIRHDGGRRTYLEFFVTEPIETLIKKRSAFIVGRQQVRDPTKWWDGVFAPYDARHGVVRTPEDPDIFTGRMAYVLTCDDPGLSKAPYLAAKNVSFPDRHEIEALEYYIEHFVWGRLQRTAQETPYPYGVYGTPDWHTNRDPARRAKVTRRNLDKMHIWRSYDYPHVMMLYFHMYEIAKMYPQLSRYLDATGYLERAYQTARAFFTYPYEIYPSYYETYKWGLYNELITLSLADALEREDLAERAEWLRAEWEKKVKYFVYDDPYPYRSEYPFDRTAFESSYALAKYGATHDMKPDERLWWDVKREKWYSHSVVQREDSSAFMERQLAANLAVRGWLETSYYQLGADPLTSYMAAMGGWAILDYALSFAPRPHDWLQLGYASYLSSWCLMNAGRPETGYGYWFPGKRHDGFAGWQFMPSKYGRAWMGADVPRGPWHYDGEIDLGFGGALRMAATIVTHDPLFGWIAYGGTLTRRGDVLSVIPRDGLRRRFVALVPDPDGSQGGDRQLRIELERDGFAVDEPIVVQRDLGTVKFAVENRTGDVHSAGMRLRLPDADTYAVAQDGRPLVLRATGNWDYPQLAELSLTGASTWVMISRVARH